MSFWKEFRTFAMRGNVLDLAVGVIVGGAFGKIVSSLVSDIIMPPLGLLIGGIDFKQFNLVLKPATAQSPAVVMHYGLFLQTIFDFTIIAFSIFLLVKLINKIHLSEAKKQVDKPGKETKEEQLLTEIRDLLKQQINK